MTMLSPYLVLLDSTIDTADEGVGGIETNRPCQQPEPNSHDERVAKVEHCGDQVHNLKLGIVVDDGIYQNIVASRARQEK